MHAARRRRLLHAGAHAGSTAFKAVSPHVQRMCDQPTDVAQRAKCSFLHLASPHFLAASHIVIVKGSTKGVANASAYRPLSAFKTYEIKDILRKLKPGLRKITIN